MTEPTKQNQNIYGQSKIFENSGKAKGSRVDRSTGERSAKATENSTTLKTSESSKKLRMKKI